MLRQRDDQNVFQDQAQLQVCQGKSHPCNPLSLPPGKCRELLAPELAHCLQCYYPSVAAETFPPRSVVTLF